MTTISILAVLSPFILGYVLPLAQQQIRRSRQRKQSRILDNKLVDMQVTNMFRNNHFEVIDLSLN